MFVVGDRGEATDLRPTKKMRGIKLSCSLLTVGSFKEFLRGPNDLFSSAAIEGGKRVELRGRSCPL
jgi:hypothetical protein